MRNDIRGILKWVRNKLELLEKRLCLVLSWVLVFLCSLLIMAFLYTCFEAVLGKTNLNRGEWIGFLVSVVLLVIGIVSIRFWKS